MAAAQQQSKKWESLDMLYVHIDVKVEVTVPTSDPLIFDYTQRRRYGCEKINAVKPGGTNTVIIHALDCTPYEACEEYRRIVNKENGHADSTKEG